MELLPHPDIFQSADNSISTFFHTCKSSDLEQLTQLIQAHDQSRDYLRWGLLMVAKSSQVAIARYLLEKGASINQIVPLMAAEGRC
jgi:hypothetical protein